MFGMGRWLLSKKSLLTFVAYLWSYIYGPDFLKCVLGVFRQLCHRAGEMCQRSISAMQRSQRSSQEGVSVELVGTNVYLLKPVADISRKAFGSVFVAFVVSAL